MSEEVGLFVWVDMRVDHLVIVFVDRCYRHSDPEETQRGLQRGTPQCYIDGSSHVLAIKCGEGQGRASRRAATDFALSFATMLQDWLDRQDDIDAALPVLDQLRGSEWGSAFGRTGGRP